MKPKMNLIMRISVNECHKQRFTEEDIKQEFAKDNVKIERTLVVRKSDGAVMGQILIDEINVLERKYERELNNPWDDDIYTVKEWVLEKSNSPLENPVKKIKTINKSIPSERVVYTKVPKVFYSFKLNCWIYVSNPFRIKGNDMYWREFLNYETREKVDDCAEISLPRLSERTLKNINNQNLF